MSWKEVSPGRFERPFDSMELFFRSLAAGGAPLKREHWAVTAVAQFRLVSPADDTVTALRQAWKTMRYEHPEIACFAEGTSKVYEVPDDAALESWVASTFMVESAKTADDMFSSFQPSKLAKCYYLPRSSEILIHSSHWRIDGIGALHLLHNFFTALAKPRKIVFGEEATKLSPGLDDAANFSIETTEDTEAAATKLLMEFAGNLPSVGLPVELSQIPGGTRRVELVFSTEETSSIIGGCRNRNLSVAVASHAALVTATQQLAPTELSCCNYTSWGAINFRPYLPSPYNNSNAHPVAVYMLGVPITLVPSGFAENASKLKEQYKRFTSPVESNLHSIVVPYVQKVTSMLNQPPPPNMPAPTEPLLNSVGVLDRYLARTFGDTVEVTNFWLGAEMLTKQLDFFVWTWQGRMSLNATYNEHFYKAEFVEAFLERVKGILLKESVISST